MNQQLPQNHRHTSETARVAIDTLMMENDGLGQIIETLAAQVSRMPFGRDREAVRKTIARMIAARTALLRLPSEDDLRMADMAIAAND
jgi:hypothetical protein